MSLKSIYTPSNKEAQYSNVFCNSINTNSLTFDGTDLMTSLNPDYLSVTKTTAQSIPSGPETSLTGYNDPSGNLSGDFNKTTGLWTVAETGYYNISAYAEFQSNANGYRQLSIRNSTASEKYRKILYAVNGESTKLTDSLCYYIPAGTFIYLQVSQTSGVPLNVEKIIFNVIRVRP